VRNRPLSAVDPSGHVDYAALPPIYIGFNWSNYNWSPSVTLGAGSQAYLAAVYGGIYRSALYNAAYYGASILPFAVGSPLQYQRYLSFLRVYGSQLQAGGYFRTRPANLTPPPEPAPASTVAAGFAISSSAYGYASGVGRAFYDFIFDPRRYWNDLASSLGRSLDACGAFCDAGTIISASSGLPPYGAVPGRVAGAGAWGLRSLANLSAAERAAAVAAEEGTATIFRYGEALSHTSIEVRVGDQLLHTEQVVDRLSGMTSVAERASSAGATNSIMIPLPNGPAALNFAKGMVGRDTGQYSLRFNSCLTYCGSVLRAGGVPGVPETTPGLIEFLRGR
jgi:hypothetical protein